MSSYTYTFSLRDIGLGQLPAAGLVVTVEPEVEAFGPQGLVSARPKPIPLDGSGSASVTLYPSGELTAASSGRTGVRYVIKVGRFEDAIDGTVFRGLDVFWFVAVAGGGNVGEMSGGSLLAVWIGPPIHPWPVAPYPKGLYLDPLPPQPWTVVE